MENPNLFEMILAFLLVLGPLILLHELGHFLVAKRSGIRALEFGMGYPPRARRLWRGKGFVIVDGVRYETPRNFDLPWDWLVYPNKSVTLTYDELDNRRLLRSIELDPEEEELLLKASEEQPQPLQANLAGQTVNAMPIPAKKRTAQMQRGAHEARGVVDEIDPGTEYTLNWLPIGGFVRMYGEEGASGQGSFNNASKRGRAATLLAGPGMNLVVALIVFTATYMLGYPESPAVIKEVSANSPAATAGLLPQDAIVAIDDVRIRNIAQVKPYIDDHAGQPVKITVQRQGEDVAVVLTPRTVAQTPEGQGKIGILFDVVAASGYTLVQHPFGESVQLAVGDIVDTVRQIVTLPTRLLAQQIAPSEAQVVGPVGISQVAATAMGQTTRTGEPFWLLNLFAAISLALAITNLLPLPALDGGRLIFIILEAVRGKRISPEREAIVHFVGMMLLLALMVLITIQDVGRLAN
ncbi:regulator of sigma E protease [Thermoflexales bacterium]|nr:regulator of sigma E protease [Thermoflexales bacterium]